jgi:hypothetical protein
MTMANARCAIVMTTVVLAVSVHMAFAQQADPRREPATALREAVRLLESKNHAEFLQKFMSPTELDRATQRFGTFDNVLAEFGRRGGFDVALKAFQAAMRVQPTLYDDGTRANYPFAEPIGGEIRLQLRKIDGLWYWAD